MKVSPGTILGGRYRVLQSDREDIRRWTAFDETLARQVRLLCLPAESMLAHSVLDAARRVSVVEDPRLLRVLDIGVHDGIQYVVQESPVGADSMMQVAASQGLPPEEVRRMVGEAANVLERARLRGLHHQALTPSCLYRLADGTVSVADTSLGAALLQLPELSPEEASATDATQLVAVLYAGLTGFWPAGALRKSGVIDASSLVAIPQQDSYIDPVSLRQNLVAQAADDPEAFDSTVAVDWQHDDEGFTLVRPDLPVAADLQRLCAKVLDEGIELSTPGEVARLLRPWSGTPVVSGDNLARPQETVSLDDDATEISFPAVDPSTSNFAAEDQPPAGMPLPHADSSKDVVDTSKSSGLAPKAHALPGAAAPTPAPNFSVIQDEDLDSPLPGFALAPNEPDEKSTHFVLLTVGVFLLIAVIAAVFAFFSSGTSVTPDKRVPVSERPTEAPLTPSFQPLQLKSARVVGGKPGGFDNPETAKNVLDGNVNSVWSTEYYYDAVFGGLKKGGGLTIDLGKTQPVRKVVFHNPGSAFAGAVYVGDSPGALTEKLANIPAKSGSITITSSPKKGRYVTIWLTKLGKAKNPRYWQARISTVQVFS